VVTDFLQVLAAEGAEVGEHVVEFAHDAPSIFVEHAWIVLALPFLATALIGAVGKRLPKGGAEIGILAMLVASVWSVGLLVSDFLGAARFEGAIQSFDWFPFGDGLSLGFGIQVDGLTAVMFVVVTLISLTVNIYSTSYMHGDSRFTWYFTVLNLFSGSMLLLVAAPNLLQMLMGWELVGVCSYLLIGHWWEKKENSDAAIKAFITTKIGDVGFVVGVFVLFAAAGTFNIPELIEKAEGGAISTFALTAGCILLFVGAAGKSAQFPLYVWLPDAMAGPTPASSLIHAATMVTAGIFMIARLFPIFEASPAAMNTVAIVAVITMLLSALLAMVQEDIKRVLAYSTISQLAYMFAALGVGAGNAAIFHLYTHAWFKALLFQGAGSLIHAVHSNNMGDMGGMRKFMPKTYWTFAAGTLALAGIFPFAGFWSKDEILTEAYTFGTGDAGAGADWVALLVYGAGIITAFLTAFYMSRLFHRTFLGDFHGHGKPHESDRMITSPLVFLAIMSVVAGLVGIPWWKEGFGTWIAVGGELHIPDANYALIAVSLLVAGGGLVLGRKLYLPHPAVDPLRKLGWFHTLLVNKYYLDDLYMRGVILPIRDKLSRAMYWVNNHVLDGAVNGAASATRALGRGLYKQVDQRLIDGAVNGAGIGTRATSGRVRRMQTGNVQRYAAILLGGVVVLAVLFTRF
jgi:NADH-quinone oxidoreductase subunit L